MSDIVQVGIEAFFAAYLLLVCVLIAGWQKATSASMDRAGSVESAYRPFVSVVIAARNEARHIPRLIADLRAQEACCFEVIIVDDGSEDDTVKHTHLAIGTDVRFNVVTSSGQGKKAALTSGIRRAKGTIILTTDADCRVGASWISEMTQPFACASTMMVFGLVRITASSLADRLQALEFATLVGAGAATAALGVPTMCNGANLAYRKEVFESVGGYENNLQIPSGDDEFLLRKVNEAFPRSVHFCALPKAMVTTLPCETLETLFDQRVRWAGKWGLTGAITSALLALWIFLFHTTVVALPWLVIAGLVSPGVATVAMLSKATMEYFYIRGLQRRVGISWSWSGFMILQFFYSYYVVLVALCARFVQFEWKGRRLRPLMQRGQRSLDKA